MELRLHILPFLLAVASAFEQEYFNISRQNSIAANTEVWPGGLIPYEFRPDFPQRDRDMFISSTKYIEARTCARFRPRISSDRYWLILVLGGCCGTHGGRRPEFIDQGQEATFSSGLPMPFYLHELGHTFSFPHEQDRPDRDDYVWWDKNKTPEKCGGDFAGKMLDLPQAAQDIPFDYVSLMADWTECYWPRSPIPQNIPLGPGTSDARTFSVVDMERINAVSECKGCFGYRFRKISQLQLNWDSNPIPAGYELDGRTFYICRVYHDGHLLIGKSLPGSSDCWAAFRDGGESRYKENFSVLTNPGNTGNFQWVSMNDVGGRQVIKGGRTRDRETIYIGRCLINNSLIPGFYLESNPKELFVPFGGSGRKCTDFEVLVCK